MACVSPDGRPTVSGLRILRAIQAGYETPEEVAQGAGFPMFRARSGIRELLQAGFLAQNGDKYALAGSGIEMIIEGGPL